jgi:hypothetical protein
MTDRNNNDPIEDFFRSKAQEYDVEYHEKDWLKLESRLDKKEREHTIRRRRNLAAAVVAILISLLAYVTYQQHLEINKLSERLTNTESWVDVPNNIPPQDMLSPDNTSSSNDNSESDSSPASDLADNRNDFGSQAQSKYSNTNLAAPPKNENTQQLIVSTGLQQNRVVVNIETSPDVLNPNKPGLSGIKPSTAKPMHPAVGNISRNQGSATTLSPASDKEWTQPTISIGVLAGPDLSTAGGISNFDSPGYKFGISIEYHLSSNFSLSAGAIRTNVHYTAKGNEYRPAAGSYSVSPTQTTAECVLIDIPVSMKYSFANFSNSRFYATAGFSSYIMLDEEYQFDFGNNQSAGLPQQLNRRTGSSHWMSNATVSVGYELDLMEGISVRAEPFLKVPLKGVGLGNVNLYSMGSLVSLNYQLK